MADLIDAEKLPDKASLLARWRKTSMPAATFRRLADAAPERRHEPRRGARLRLARKIPLPAKFQFFDEESGLIYAAQVVWRQGGEIGCRLAVRPTPNKAPIERRMKNRFFAV